MVFAIIDTNIVVSALLANEPSKSIPMQILSEALTGCVTPIVTDEILEEYVDVLHRDKFKFSAQKVNIILDGIIKRAVQINTDGVTSVLPDLDDVCFYNALLATTALKSILITGNSKHFPNSSSIMTPSEFYFKYLV